MKIILFLLIYFLIPDFLNAEINKNIFIMGSDGQSIILNSPAKKIISLAPSVTEILFDIGAGDSVIAVGAGSDFPKEAQRLPIVAGVRTINLERIVSMNPDLVIAWNDGTSPLAIESLRRLNIPVLVIADSHLSDIPKLIQILGKVTKKNQEADKQAQVFTQALNFYQTKYSHKNLKNRVFIQIGSLPLFTAGGDSIQSEIVNICGGENIFGDINRAASEVSIEAVIERNPDWIIGLEPFDRTIWTHWPEIEAVKNHQELEINPDLMASNGPRVIVAVRQICQAMHEIPLSLPQGERR